MYNVVKYYPRLIVNLGFDIQVGPSAFNRSVVLDPNKLLQLHTDILSNGAVKYNAFLR